MANYTTAERFTAFLLTYLPRLSAVASVMAHEKTGSRYVPLIAAHEAAIGKPGVCLEFGVFKGASINYTGKKYSKRKFFGFDSFEGFPSDGRSDWDQDFSVGGKLPEVPPNVTLVKGFFSDTLPGFLAKLTDDVAVVNVDCDIYSSTKDVFDTLIKHKRLRPGVTVAFDELINYREFLWNEIFALFEMLEATGLGIRWLSVHQKVRGLEETITMLWEGNHPTWGQDQENGYRQQASLILTEGGLDLSILDEPYSRKRVLELAKRLSACVLMYAPEFLPKLGVRT
ncbi:MULTISPECIES: TylF/MycF/NovP-related O-methyltransferase [unclassified Sinorhizobium]|uniref:TylF/MycF/NovP-related O-methyltransferase n=1 Tax=unclassified Sinorhizobium TaxID=2613772 RepID=UPI0024C35EC5|nr:MULTISPECIES: TylF/MycF/NovP-related O-methyltransferase [unclassified Sinorhizobium]MDK1374544.1 TylF/MycF/NovP-related O-methyltransferase [Sinorhizobium sp. 6-70]MDK1478257.1 TylF/MycF/NovP-related O-methyltransferase [Sinorhizobium sp. 6-117]